jgi:hypothetical protein
MVGIRISTSRGTLYEAREPLVSRQELVERVLWAVENLLATTRARLTLEPVQGVQGRDMVSGQATEGDRVLRVEIWREG